MAKLNMSSLHQCHRSCYRYRIRKPRYVPWDISLNQPVMPNLVEGHLSSANQGLWFISTRVLQRSSLRSPDAMTQTSPDSPEIFDCTTLATLEWPQHRQSIFEIFKYFISLGGNRGSPWILVWGSKLYSHHTGQWPTITFLIILWVAIGEVRKTPRYQGHEECMYFHRTACILRAQNTCTLTKIHALSKVFTLHDFLPTYLLLDKTNQQRAISSKSMQMKSSDLKWQL